jgi:phosphatidate cytidylyltransferase
MLQTRILTSLVLVPFLLAALFLLPELYWALLLLFVLSLGAWEWANMAGFLSAARVIYVSLTACTGLVFLSISLLGLDVQNIGMSAGLLAGSVFWLMLVPLWLLSRYQFKNKLLMAMTGWLVILPTWLALLTLHAINPWLLLSILVAVWIADSAAYFAGKRYGKHKLAVAISPGKTWEGVAGAWLAVSIYGLCICRYRELDFWLSAALLVALWGIVALSIMGDLFESLIKRQAGMKDSGTLLPGHGGILDRIDGLTSSLPVAATVVYIPYWLQLYDASALKG